MFGTNHRQQGKHGSVQLPLHLLLLYAAISIHRPLQKEAAVGAVESAAAAAV
jgi:hypothetical protein